MFFIPFGRNIFLSDIIFLVKWKIFFNVSCTAGLMLMDFLSAIVYQKNFLYFTFIFNTLLTWDVLNATGVSFCKNPLVNDVLKDFAGYRILCWQLFFSNTLKMFHCLLICTVLMRNMLLSLSLLLWTYHDFFFHCS